MQSVITQKLMFFSHGFINYAITFSMSWEDLIKTYNIKIHKDLNYIYDCYFVPDYSFNITL